MSLTKETDRRQWGHLISVKGAACGNHKTITCLLLQFKEWLQNPSQIRKHLRKTRRVCVNEQNTIFTRMSRRRLWSLWCRHHRVIKAADQQIVKRSSGMGKILVRKLAIGYYYTAVVKYEQRNCISITCTAHTHAADRVTESAHAFA